MKIFAIRKSSDKKPPAYLFYYEKAKEFYIEIDDGLSDCDVPIILDSVYAKGIKSVGPYWSRVWVQQRIVPRDRQNIGDIIRDNGLKNYDEYQLLTLVSGRCEQDDYYIEPIKAEDIPENINERKKRHIENILPFEKSELIVFFQDGSIKKCSFEKYFRDNINFSVLLKNPEYFSSVKVMTGGYGISWDTNLCVDFETLYAMASERVLFTEILIEYLQNNIMTTNDVMSELGCSRQYVNELVKKGVLRPIRCEGKVTLFLRKDVMEFLWD